MSVTSSRIESWFYYSFIALIVVLTVIGVMMVRTHVPDAFRTIQTNQQAIERQHNEALAECATSPGCDPSTRTTKPDSPQVIPARRQP